MNGVSKVANIPIFIELIKIFGSIVDYPAGWRLKLLVILGFIPKLNKQSRKHSHQKTSQQS
jgi:hypothetical protein